MGVSIGITGLESDKKWGSVQLGLAVLSLFFCPPTFLQVIGCLLIGLAVGAFRIFCFSKGHLKWGDWSVVLGLPPLLLLIFASGEAPTWRTALSLGMFLSGIQLLLPVLASSYIDRKLSSRNQAIIDAFTPRPQLSRDEALAQLRSDYPSPLWDQLEAEALIGCHLIPAETISMETTTLSCLGGRPEWPSDPEWPRWNEQPLECMACLNLEQVNASLPFNPGQGALLFFYAAQEQPWGYEAGALGSGRIFYLKNPPHMQGPLLPLRLQADRFFNIDEPTQSKLWEMQDSFAHQPYGGFSGLAEALKERKCLHQFLGAPNLVQGDMYSELELAATLYGLPQETSWTLLLQIDSETRLNWCWGDAGVLYFWIPSDDLAQARFDRPWVVLQCT